MTTPVERCFDRRAAAYDRRYDRESLQRLMRPALLRGRDYVVSVSRSLDTPRVLEAGCGPGRLGERILAAGAGEYVGVDVSGEMVALSRRRLSRFGSRATITQSDFAEAEVDGPFELVFALGLFDYLAEPERYLQRMAEECSGILIATFPRWAAPKAPLRTLMYQRLYGCTVYYFDVAHLERLLALTGLTGADVVAWRSGFRLTARLSTVRLPGSSAKATDGGMT